MPKPRGGPGTIPASKGCAAAQFALGAMYTKGLGVAEEATKVPVLVPGCCGTGMAGGRKWIGVIPNFHGEGVPQDRAQAAYWYEKSA